MKRLEGKVAVITGGNSGIGLASAKRLQEEGARVVIVGRSQKTLDEAAKALGNGVLAIQADVSKLGDIDKIYAAVEKKHGKIDVLWYDVAWPLTAEGWESERMNKMVFELQPDIIVNNRNLLPGDFSTPEQTIVKDPNGRAWESCMTLNDSWGFQRADDSWKSSKQVVRNLIECASQGGNYLLNIGPHADGTIPAESVRIFQEVGQWMQRNGDTIYTSDVCQVDRSNYASFTRTGNTLFMHVYFWPGETVTLAGLQKKVKSARFHATGKNVTFTQDRFRVRFTGLPADAPDHPVTTLAIECDGEPMQDMMMVRKERPRDGV